MPLTPGTRLGPYELLTGQRAFAGEDAADFIAAVITKEPDSPLLPPATPPRIVELLKRVRPRVRPAETRALVLNIGRRRGRQSSAQLRRRVSCAVWS